MNCGVIERANCLIAILHQIGDALYVPTEEAIYASLDAKLEVDLIGPFYAKDAGVDAMRICKKSYLLLPYVGIFLY